MRRISLTRRRWLHDSFVAAGAALWGVSGCDKPAPKLKAVKTSPVALKVLVIDDETLGEAIAREYRSRTEAEVQVIRVGMSEVAAASRFPADIVIFPAFLLGHLVERGLIRPLNPAMLDSEEIDRQDILPLTRRVEIVWGQTTYALPIGSSCLVLAYRPDILEKRQITVPATWEELQAAAEQLSDRQALANLAPPEDQPWRSIAEPLGPGFGGHLLLARAAAYATHREQAAPLFNLANLAPLIDQPPYVRALTEFAASAQLSEQPPIGTCQEAFGELLAGRCAMAICWPAFGADAAGKALPAINFSELPGAAAVYNFGRQRWEEREANEDRRVPLVSMAGRLAAVTSSSGEAAAAEGFVGWLTAGDVSSRIASYSPQAWPCRASHRKVLSRWLGELPQPAAESYFAAIEQSQSHAQSLPAVRLIEPHRYLEALDEAVSRTINEKQQPQAALEEAAAAWQKITAEVGIDEQKAALRHSLGLD